MNALYALEEDERLSAILTEDQRLFIKNQIEDNKSVSITNKFYRMVARRNKNIINSVFKNLVSNEACKYICC